MPDQIHDTTTLANFTDAKMNKINLYESPKLFCDIYCLLPGQTQKPHAHEQNDKIYHALTGTCQVQLGEEVSPLAPGQTAIAKAGQIHGLENKTDQPATLLVIMAPHPSK